MQTRRLRLGDVVDDYCPRERRLSNHVVVAMVDDTIKQTRCSTCDFEHPYKEAKVPSRRKKKDASSALFQEVLENVTSERVAPPGTESPATAPALPVVTPAPKGVLRPNGLAGRDAEGPTAPDAAAGAAPGTPTAPHDDREDATDRPAEPEEDAPLHRRALIRATLPRPVGEVPVRQMPSFTIREAAAARPNKFRYKARPPGGAGAGMRQGRPQGAGGPGGQTRPGGARGPQGRGAGKKGGSGHPNRPGGQHASRGQKGPHGNKRFK